jgi:hypothetical protein
MTGGARTRIQVDGLTVVDAEASALKAIHAGALEAALG